MTKDWNTLLKEHDDIVKKSNATIYERAKLLVAVYENPEYIAAMKREGKQPTAALDERLSDTCASFLELMHMMAKFPKKRDWVTGDLALMRRQTLSDLVRTKPPKEGEETTVKAKRATKRTVTLHEHEELQLQQQTLKAEYAHLQEKYEMVLQENARLNEQVSDLRKLCNVLGAEDGETPKKATKKRARRVTPK